MSEQIRVPSDNARDVMREIVSLLSKKGYSLEIHAGIMVEIYNKEKVVAIKATSKEAKK